MNGNQRVRTSGEDGVFVDKQAKKGRFTDEGAPTSGQQQSLHVRGSATGSTSHRAAAGLLGCYQADSLSNMAASSNAEQTQLQDMEEEDAGMEEREMESDEEEEEGMGVENSDDDEDDSSEDEKENEAEIQRLEEQVISQQTKPKLS
ncbi:squamous cell carcinoma antigen recognized by T-cells 3 [Lates japonicus]|uniref:Squamous cell carcinoma antigen recognized by T-cells 3 n=1 Tax=Lates japonicus TaxID=270547 RepID=A0AAD3N5H5_LATJO|nr:squamous cell carcinoma antigen recognized by T-cells 3 [Lates japonicus]